jgi:type I restriction-modification system DNA methylase subunit
VSHSNRDSGPIQHGRAKDIGIVLTPRHVTEFAAEILDIGHKDIVYDPTCGTGGFLVAAFDKVRRESNEKQVVDFKENRLFGIEQEPEVIALAVVNMIFRGDGKNNIIGGNCFYKHLTAANNNGVPSAEYVDSDSNNDPPVTKILMNPPFGLDDEDEQSYKFIEHVLDDMEDGGILFSVVNYSALVKQNQSKQWREDLLDNHTVLSVMTFPNDLFYPVGVETAGIVIKKGESHPDDQDVLWARPVRDGRLKSKGKRLPHPDEPNQFEELETITKAFISSPGIKVEDENRFITTQQINTNDSFLELVPEEYVPAPEPTQSEFINKIDRFLEQLIGNLMLYIDDFDSTIFRASLDKDGQKGVPDESEIEYEEFDFPALFDIETGEYHVATEPSEGPHPLISCPVDRNGIVKSRGDLIYCDVPDEHLHRDALTVAYNGQPLTARFHPYTFAAKDDVAVLTANEDYDLSPAAKIYIANAIEQNKWRYGYGRKCYKDKMHDRRVKLPTRDGELAIDYMQQVVKHSSYWQVLEQYMQDRVEFDTNKELDSENQESSQAEESVAEIDDYIEN